MHSAPTSTLAASAGTSQRDADRHIEPGCRADRAILRRPDRAERAQRDPAPRRQRGRLQGAEGNPFARRDRVWDQCGGVVRSRPKAASPGSTNPAYRLKIAAKIPIAKLKAKHRKVTTRRGKKALTIDTPADPAIRFRSIRREGPKFILLKAGPLPERGVGGVFTNPKTAFTADGYPELYQLRHRAEKDLPEAVSKAIRDHLAKRKKR